MRSRLRVLGLAVAVLLTQELAAILLPEPARPDLVLLFALALGLRSRGTGGLVFAFALGYAVDALSSAPPGLNALLYGTACAVTRLCDRGLNLRAPLSWGIYATGYYLLHAVLLKLALGLLEDPVHLAWTDLLTRVPGAALATGLLAAPLYGLLRYVDTGAERETGFSTLATRSARP